jgi:hypothetical protein
LSGSGSGANRSEAILRELQDKLQRAEVSDRRTSANLEQLLQLVIGLPEKTSALEEAVRRLEDRMTSFDDRLQTLGRMSDVAHRPEKTAESAGEFAPGVAKPGPGSSAISPDEVAASALGNELGASGKLDPEGSPGGWFRRSNLGAGLRVGGLILTLAAAAGAAFWVYA